MTYLNETSCCFVVNANLLINEAVTLQTSWTVTSEAAGNFTLRLTAASMDEYMHEDYRSGANSCEAQIVSGSPVIGEPLITPSSYSPGLEPGILYAQPLKDVSIECEVTGILGVRSVVIHYSTGSPLSWNMGEMELETGSRWIGTLSGQPSGSKLYFYIEATGPYDAGSKTDIYECVFLDVQMLEERTGIAMIITALVLVSGSLAIINFYRARMKDVL